MIFSEQMHFNIKWNFTSMPSLFMIVVSIFMIAALMAPFGGNFVMPILMALERFVSKTVSSVFLLPSWSFFKIIIKL